MEVPEPVWGAVGSKTWAWVSCGDAQDAKPCPGRRVTHTLTGSAGTPFWHCSQRGALALSCHLPSHGKEEPDMGDQPTNSFIAGWSSGKNTIPTAGSHNPQGHRLCPKERGEWTLDITPLAMGSYHLATQAPFHLGSSHLVALPIPVASSPTFQEAG